MIDVACIGILVADVIAKPVKDMQEKGLSLPVDSIDIYSGGNAMTAAINITRLGFRSSIIGKIGNDVFGRFLKGILEENKVDCRGLRIDNAVQTSASVLMIDDGGERSYLHCTGANAVFSIEDIDWTIIDSAKIIFVTGTFLLDTFDGTQTMSFLKKCKEKGKITALDVCWDSQGRWSDVLNICMPYIDIFMPSIDEAKQLSHRENPDEIADDFFEKGCKSVVIKLGKDGCYIREHKAMKGKILPTYSEIKAIDTTGAGDSFCSGFLAALAKGLDFESSAMFANAVGTHCVMEKGATTGIKSFDEIVRFMEEHTC